MTLKEYRDKKAEDTWQGCHGCDENDKNFRNTGFKEGFNSALALELPVKFASWAFEEEGYSYFAKKAIADDKNSINNYNQLFQYWLNNIYKIPKNDTQNNSY